MAMSKKHYVKIANIVYGCFNNNMPHGRKDGYDWLVTRLADSFAEENPNFHRGKFIHACHNGLNK